MLLTLERWFILQKPILKAVRGSWIKYSLAAVGVILIALCIYGVKFINGEQTKISLQL
jgi:hypothetical protein